MQRSNPAIRTAAAHRAVDPVFALIDAKQAADVAHGHAIDVQRCGRSVWPISRNARAVRLPLMAQRGRSSPVEEFKAFSALLVVRTARTISLGGNERRFRQLSLSHSETQDAHCNFYSGSSCSRLRGENSGRDRAICSRIIRPSASSPALNRAGIASPCSCARRSSHRSCRTFQLCSSYVPLKITGLISMRGRSKPVLPSSMARLSSFAQRQLTRSTLPICCSTTPGKR